MYRHARRKSKGSTRMGRPLRGNTTPAIEHIFTKGNIGLHAESSPPTTRTIVFHN